MKFDKSTKILIIGLGVIGGSYAKALTDKGYDVSCITKEESDIRYALKNGMISRGTTEVEPELVAESELIIFALYPTTFIDWIKKYQNLLSPGTLITDVTGVKSQVVYKVQDMLREDVEFIPAHPMANISTVSSTVEIMPLMRLSSPVATLSATSGISRPANEALIADGKSTSGNTILPTVPYAASDISLELPLFSRPRGMRICSIVTRAERI